MKEKETTSLIRYVILMLFLILGAIYADIFDFTNKDLEQSETDIYQRPLPSKVE